MAGRNAFTTKDDDFLIAYLAKNNPGVAGRAGKTVYQDLVNDPNNLPRANNHPWQSWRDRYAKRRDEFDREIKRYQKRKSLPTENAKKVVGSWDAGRVGNGKRKRKQAEESDEDRTSESEEDARRRKATSKGKAKATIKEHGDGRADTRTGPQRKPPGREEDSADTKPDRKRMRPSPPHVKTESGGEGSGGAQRHVKKRPSADSSETEEDDGDENVVDTEKGSILLKHEEEEEEEEEEVPETEQNDDASRADTGEEEEDWKRPIGSEDYSKGIFDDEEGEGSEDGMEEDELAQDEDGNESMEGEEDPVAATVADEDDEQEIVEAMMLPDPVPTEHGEEEEPRQRRRSRPWITAANPPAPDTQNEHLYPDLTHLVNTSGRKINSTGSKLTPTAVNPGTSTTSPPKPKLSLDRVHMQSSVIPKAKYAFSRKVDVDEDVFASSPLTNSSAEIGNTSDKPKRRNPPKLVEGPFGNTFTGTIRPAPRGVEDNDRWPPVRGQKTAPLERQQLEVLRSDSRKGKAKEMPPLSPQRVYKAPSTPARSLRLSSGPGPPSHLRSSPIKEDLAVTSVQRLSTTAPQTSVKFSGVSSSQGTRLVSSHTPEEPRLTPTQRRRSDAPPPTSAPWEEKQKRPERRKLGITPRTSPSSHHPFSQPRHRAQLENGVIHSTQNTDLRAREDAVEEESINWDGPIDWGSPIPSTLHQSIPKGNEPAQKGGIQSLSRKRGSFDSGQRTNAAAGPSRLSVHSSLPRVDFSTSIRDANAIAGPSRLPIPTHQPLIRSLSEGKMSVDADDPFVARQPTVTGKNTGKGKSRAVEPDGKERRHTIAGSASLPGVAAVRKLDFRSSFSSSSSSKSIKARTRKSLPQTLHRRRSFPSFATNDSDNRGSGQSPVPIPPQDQNFLTHLGFASALKLMSTNHGFTEEVVRNVYKEVLDLRKTDDVLARMREKADEAGQGLIKRLSNPNSAAPRNSAQNGMTAHSVTAAAGSRRVVSTSAVDSSPTRKPKEDRTQPEFTPTFINASDDEYDRESEYSPPTGSRAGKIVKLLRQGRMEEALSLSGDRRRNKTTPKIGGVEHKDGREPSTDVDMVTPLPRLQPLSSGTDTSTWGEEEEEVFLTYVGDGAVLRDLERRFPGELFINRTVKWLAEVCEAG